MLPRPPAQRLRRRPPADWGCDDGNVIDGDGCDAICTRSICFGIDFRASTHEDTVTVDAMRRARASSSPSAATPPQAPPAIAPCRR
jgi:hypothetical protein